MATLTAKFFDWARSPSRENERARTVPASPRKIGSFFVRDKTLFLGNVEQLRNGFNDFLFGVCRQVLDRAGRDQAGVELDRQYSPAVAALFGEFLSKGHSLLPALGWVIPVTSSLAAHTGNKGPTHIEGTQFGIDPVHGKLLVPLGGGGHHRKFDIEVSSRDFPWVMPECSSLALIPRIYQGNGFFSWRRQFTIASFADSDAHRQFFRENDLVIAHEEGIVRNETGTTWHSRNPLICCGRLRPYPHDIAAGREQPYRAIFDYIALVLDARSRGIISVSFLSVDFEQWIQFWSDVGDAIRDVVAPELIDLRGELSQAITLERCRRFLLKEIEGWRLFYKASRHSGGIEWAIDRVLEKARRCPGWRKLRGNSVNAAKDYHRRLEELSWAVAHVECFDDYLDVADHLLDIQEEMIRRRTALGFALPNE